MEVGPERLAEASLGYGPHEAVVAQIRPVLSEPNPMVSTNVASLLKERVELELECIDRMYLNLYVPILQTPEGLVGFLRQEPGVRVFSTTSVAPMTRAFVSSIERFAGRHGLDLIDFPKGQRKEDVALEYRRKFKGKEGVLFIGRAQEKTRVFRTVKRRDERGTFPWIVRGTAIPNHFYFYALDRDFGPFFIKFCSYFPYAARSASTVTSGSSASSSSAGSSTRRSTTACSSARTQVVPRRSLPSSMTR